MQKKPLGGEATDAALGDVHLDGQEDGEGPESQAAHRPTNSEPAAYAALIWCCFVGSKAGHAYYKGLSHAFRMHGKIPKAGWEVAIKTFDLGPLPAHAACSPQQ